jgi:hypothetical protein
MTILVSLYQIVFGKDRIRQLVADVLTSEFLTELAKIDFKEGSLTVMCSIGKFKEYGIIKFVYSRKANIGRCGHDLF